MIRSKAIRESARGETCTLQVAGVCNHNSETTVFAHFRWLGSCGVGIKPGDLQGAYACSECNRWTDSPTHTERDQEYESSRNFYAMRALIRTQERLVSKGILVVK